MKTNKISITFDTVELNESMVQIGNIKHSSNIKNVIVLAHDKGVYDIQYKLKKKYRYG